MRGHKPITLIAVGDLCPGDHLCMGFGVGSLARKHGPAFALQHIGDILREGDIVFGNCEGVLSDIGLDLGNIDTMEFRGSPSFAQTLRSYGFTVLTVANNHVGEHGREAMRETFSSLCSAGLEVIGIRNGTRTSVPLVQEVKGLRIGWLAYTWLVSGNSDLDRESLAYTKGAEVPHEVAMLRPQVDFLIVSAHWGREYVTVPPQTVINNAHAIADAGADLILGHHPHVLQGIERRGQCLIVYSLGNFLFDMWQPRLRETALFRCTIESGKICSPEFVPLLINKKFQPALATSARATRILRRIERRSNALKDPTLAPLRDDTRVAQLERKKKRWLARVHLLYLAVSLKRMGIQIAYQKLGRHLPRLLFAIWIGLPASIPFHNLSRHRPSLSHMRGSVFRETRMPGAGLLPA